MLNKEPRPWEAHPDIWPTKSSFFVWLRGNLRRALWEKNPIKIKFKNQKCSPPPQGLETRAKTGAYCALTGEWVGKSKLEVDHIEGNVSLKDWDDLLSFCQHLCTPIENMQLVSKEAHKIKSHAERKGISFQEALIEKQAIAITKMSVDEVKQWLIDHGVEPASNAAARREQVVGVLTRGTDNA